MAYPSIQQYQEALQHPATAFSDAALAKGKIRSSGLGTPIVVSGGFALTYAVEASGTKYAVRCFHREAKGLERRYAAISTKLRALTSPYFLDFEYQPKGVKVGGAAFPVVKMAWASGETLGEFVEDNHADRAKLSNLLASLDKLAAYLHQQGIAHGDIQEGNLMVADAGRRIQLIDYDGMFVPEIASLGGAEIGHRDYQHPKRDNTQYDGTLDRFSFLALNLALRALCEKPTLWASSQSGAGVILFRANDFADPSGSQVLSDISKIQSLQREARSFAAICAARYADIPNLPDFVAGRNIPQISVQIQVTKAQLTTLAGYISQYPVLAASDYAAFLRNQGQMVELVGRIIEVKVDKTRYGKPYVFINFAPWQGQAVKINLWSEALSKSGENPSQSWVGRWVTIKGLVEPVFKRARYEHISITAGALSQISQLTETEARYRLTPRTANVRINTPSATNNTDALNRLRTGTSPGAPASAPHAPPSVSGNQQLLQRMQQQRPSSQVPSRSQGSTSHRGAPAPSPSTRRQWPGTAPQKPKGLLEWLFGLFK
jgi:serine/threonine protein kinase